MVPRKIGGKVIGAYLNKTEQKAMDMEIQRAMAKYDELNSREIDAAILWLLHTEFGFGPAKLKRVYDLFEPMLDALIKRYELENSDGIWLCTRKLKEYGIDLEEWEREKRVSKP